MRLERSPRQCFERLTRDGFAVIEEALDGVGNRARAVLASELLDTPLARLHRGNAGPEIATCRLRHADVGHDDVHHRGNGLTPLEQLDLGQLQALLEDFRRIGADAARCHAADVRPMRLVRNPGDELLRGEDREDQGHIVHVADPSAMGDVGREDVAWMDVSRREFFDDGTHTVIEHADEGWNAGARAR